MDENFKNNSENKIEETEDIFSASNTESEPDPFVIGKGFVVSEEEPENRVNNKKRSGGKNIVKNIIWIALIVVISVSVAFGAIYLGFDYLGLGKGKVKPCEIDIKMGSSTAQIAEQLKEEGVIRSAMAFRVYSKIKKYDSRYKYGVYTINNDAGYAAIADKLVTEGKKIDGAKVKIPEAATVDDIAELLEANGVCSKEDFIYELRYGTFDFDFVKEIPSDEVYYRLEGYLYPDTYEFYKYNSQEGAHLAINKMLQNFDTRITKEMRQKVNNSNYSLHEVLSLASVVELESGGCQQADRQKVARVFLNRLEGVNWNEGAFLRSDPTTYYPYGEGRYNTYKREGIPVGPLCSPSLASIKAVIYPEENLKATYFVTDSDGKFYYNETLSGHNKTVSDLKKAGKWIYSTLGS